MPFLDLLLKRTNSGGLKLSVYRKHAHTDQYLNFMSYHPIDHKMSVVRTLLERSQNLVSEPVSETEWSFQKARRQMKQMKPKKKKKNRMQQ